MTRTFPLATIVIAVVLALAAGGPARAQCAAACAQTNSVVDPSTTTIGTHTNCVCRCAYGFVRGPKSICQPDPAAKYLPGSAEWSRTEKACVQQGLRTLARLRSAKPATVSLSQYSFQACAAYDDAVRQEKLGGCLSTCGRQVCDSLMQLRATVSAKEFDVRAKPTISMRWSSCNEN